MQEVKDRPTFTEMIQFFFDKSKGMTTQPPFLSVHIEAVRRVTSVLETKFNDTVAALQQAALLQSEQVKRSVEMVDNAHEGMIAAVRHVGRKTERHAKLLKGMISWRRKTGIQGKVFNAWKLIKERKNAAKEKLKEIIVGHETKIGVSRLRKWKETAVFAMIKDNSRAVKQVADSTAACLSRVGALEQITTELTESKASVTALKQVQTVAEQRDYSAFLKEIFEYVGLQTKQMSSVFDMQSMDNYKEYTDKQCRKLANSLTERLDLMEKRKDDGRLNTLERVLEGVKLQNTLLTERINKLDYLLKVEDSEFKVSVLCQQLMKLEGNVERLQTNLQTAAQHRESTPLSVYKRPSTVNQVRRVTRSRETYNQTGGVDSSLSLPTPSHHNASLIHAPERRFSPQSPKKSVRTPALIREEVPTPPLTAGGTLESTPVNRRRVAEHKGRVRSGKPFAESSAQNRRLVDEMVIFNARVAAP